jgi:hypothetical protein
MIPQPLQLAIKAALGGSFAWVICQSLDFSPKLAPLMGCVFAVFNLGVSWSALTQLTLMSVGVYILGALGAVLWGNNYLTIFLFILISGYFWQYLQIRGVIGAFFGLAIKFPVVIIHANVADPITFAFNLFSDQMIGMAVGITINQLFWPSANRQGLEQQVKQFFNNSQQLMALVLEGYLAQNLDRETSQTLQDGLQKSLQTSQKLLKVGTYDITGQQLGKTTDWMAVVNTQQNLYLHLSAILRLVQSSQGVTLPEEIRTDLNLLSEQFVVAFSAMGKVMLIPQSHWDLSTLNAGCEQLKADFFAARNAHHLTNISLSELIVFYGLLHRLEKICQEMNGWATSENQPSIPLLMASSR